MKTIRLVVISSALTVLTACTRVEADVKLATSAQALLDKNDVKGAVIQLKNALQKNPKSAQARFLLGKTLLASGDPVAALIELRKAKEALTPDTQVVPEIARAMLLAGEAPKLIVEYGGLMLPDAAAAADLKTSLAAAYVVQGDMTKGREITAEALKSQPGYAPAVILRARLDAAQGDHAEALRLLDDVLTRDAGNEPAGLLKGEILLLAKNDSSAAMAAFYKVQHAHPRSIAARAAVINVLLQQNNLGEAKTEFEQLKKIAASHPETLFLQAQFAFNDKNFKATREITERILVASPENVRVLVLAGAAEYMMQQYVRAEGLLSRALNNAPSQVMTRQILAQAYLRLAQPEKALAVLQPAIESANADSTTLGLAGEAYLQAGDSQRSEASFQKALKVAPGDARVRTSLAVAQLARGDDGSAVTQLEAIAQGDSDTRADLVLISARLGQNDYKGALTAIAGLEKKLPDSAVPYILRGRVLALQGDGAGATASFEKAVAKEPNNYPAIASLAALDVISGKPEQARKRFENLLKADPKSFRASLALAELDTLLGAPESAVEAHLRTATKIEPAQPGPHLLLIDRLLINGNGQGALVAARNASAALPNDMAIMDAMGRAQIAAHDSRGAVSTYRKLVGLQPKEPLYQVRMADAFMADEDRASAERALRQALDIKPDDAMAQRGLALLALLDKRPKDGIAIARSIQKDKPKEAVGFALEGELEANLKNWDAAAAAYRGALQRGRSTDLAIKLHGSLSEAGKRTEAERHAADWQRDNPKDAVFHYYLGDVALAKKDLPTAETQYRAVVGLQPRNALALNNIAWLLVTQGKPGAMTLAEQANTLLPDRAPILDTLAMAQESENQLPKAIETQKRAIALDPKSPALKLRLARLFIKQGDKAAARAELVALAKLGDKFSAQDEVTTLLKSL